MSVYLFKERKAKISFVRSNVRITGSEFFPISINPVDSSYESNQICGKIKAAFQRVIKRVSDSCSYDSQVTRCVDVEFRVELLAPPPANTKVCAVLEGSLLSTLHEDFKKRLAFKLQMYDIKDGPESIPGTINIACFQMENENGASICIGIPYGSDNSWLLTKFHTGSQFTATFTLTAEVDPVDMSPILNFRRYYSDLKEEQAGDEDQELTISTENGGKAVRCMKSQLEAISPVFSSWMQRWQDCDKDNVLKLTEAAGLSSKSASAFEKFLGESDPVKAIRDATHNPNIALELLEFGHLFMMQPLVDMMKNIFEEKLHEYHFDIALRLYIISDGILMENLKLKALQAVKANAAQLRESRVMRSLVDDECLTMELKKLFNLGMKL